IRKSRRLRLLSSGDAHYSTRLETSKKAKPKIHGIFKILSADSNLKPYHKYRSALVTSSPPLLSRTKNPANEQFLFHGTIGIMPLCSIIRNSFDVERCVIQIILKVKHKFRRFGKGIYTSACSSKSSTLRVLLVSRVINSTGLTEPPPGYHSVIGEPGVDLNYEETVVYHNDAIRPAFLVVYGDKPPDSKSKIRSVIANLFKTPLAA
ncbi:hypothetical protein BJ912DRAFT_976584, partial [Pholiota molesta]